MSVPDTPVTLCSPYMNDASAPADRQWQAARFHVANDPASAGWPFSGSKAMGRNLGASCTAHESSPAWSARASPPGQTSRLIQPSVCRTTPCSRPPLACDEDSRGLVNDLPSPSTWSAARLAGERSCCHGAGGPQTNCLWERRRGVATAHTAWACSVRPLARVAVVM
jgi:hypothetical protein